MKERYGDKAGERVFYAKANKNPAMKPEADRKKIRSRLPNYNR